jgi:shikimate kinase
VLVGFMGCGKSVVGAALAERLGWTLVDMDRAIEEEAGRPVAAIFAAEGEAGFRARELALARALAGRARLVVAAGGGAFAAEDTRAELRRGALTVWLRCALETVLARVPIDGTRPLASSRERISNLFAEREPSYRLADCTFEADAATPADIARQIEEALISGPRAASERTP